MLKKYPAFWPGIFIRFIESALLFPSVMTIFATLLHLLIMINPMKKRIAAILIILVSMSCEKKDPVIPNEEELITTLTYTLIPTTGGQPIVFEFKDLDGDGGIAPLITSGTLAPNSVYTGYLQLLNEIDNEDITSEIKEESEEHQFFFTFSGLNADVDYTDTDGDGNPLGLNTTLTTGAVSNGQLTITLRHEPNKSAAGVRNGDLTNAGGETDIEVTFDVSIE